MMRAPARFAFAAALSLAAVCGCAGTSAQSPQGASALDRNVPPAADDATLGLWRMDELIGTQSPDAGRFALLGVAGIETRSDYGRFGRARVFTRSLDSFIEVPFNPAMDAAGAFTIEAWVRPNSYGLYEDTPIAARWTAQNADHSWIFSIVGNQLRPPLVPALSPGDHSALVGSVAAGTLYFAFQPAEAGVPRAYYSTRAIETARWTHVAASYDGQVVRLWIDGRLDSQYASLGRIRSTQAPLEIGNTIDPHVLSSFGGDLRASNGGDPTPYYAFDGLIDEVRLSSVARDSFETVRRP
ncbi:MAG: LamG domain-containing protein [Candidatus Eiseniibacteriota bacterium]